VSNAAFWDVEPVYTGGFGAGDVSLAVDSLDIPVVSFAANGALYVAVKTLYEWNTEFVAEVGYWGGWSSLAFDASGHLCTAFVDASGTTAYLKYAVKSSGTWVVETVDDMGWLPNYVSLAFAPSGEACIAYSKTVGTYPNFMYYVCFAYRVGANNWVKQNVAAIGGITGPSLAITSDGTRYITFIDKASGQLKLAVSTGSTWLITGLDGSLTNPVVGYASICLANNKPVVAYFKDLTSNLALRYAYTTGDRWVIETARSLARGGPCHCAVVATPAGIPVIGYSDPATGAFVETWKCGGGWFTKIIDESYNTGFSPRFRVTASGDEIYAAYFDNQDWNVYFARAYTPRSINEVKSIPDGTPVQLSGVVVSNARGELGNLIYVQHADRSCGIRLWFSSDVPSVARGMVLDIQGELATIAGERSLVDPGLLHISDLSEPKPLAMLNRDVGGGALGFQQGVSGASGLNNMGLLVSTWGRVLSSSSGSFVIEDGSGVQLKCYAPNIDLPSVGSYVKVTGISSCELTGTGLRRLLRVRDSSDVVNYGS
jgi:hypothetical protein